MKRIGMTLLTMILAAASLAMAAQEPAATGAPPAKATGARPEPKPAPAKPDPAAAAQPAATTQPAPSPPVYRYPLKLLGFKSVVNQELKDVVVTDITIGRAGFSADGKSRIWKLSGTFRNPTGERASPTAALVLYQGDRILGGIPMLDGRFTIEPGRKAVQEQKVELPRADVPDGFGVTERLPWLRTTPGVRDLPVFARPPANAGQGGPFAQPPGRPGTTGGPGAGQGQPGQRPGFPEGGRWGRDRGRDRRGRD